jgi:hypothetical protein
MTAGQTIPSYIEMKNVGSKAWDSSTHLGTTQPRDRDSVFADSTWLSPNRPSGVTGTVAVGGTYKFEFDLHAPDAPGTYYEYFNLVEEGVAWFSDPGQGGPPDDDLEVQIHVTAAPDAGSHEDSGSHEDAGAHQDAGTHADAGEREDSGDNGPATPTDDAGAVDPTADGGEGDGGIANGASTSGSSGGCAAARGATDAVGIGWVLGAAVAISAARRRRR